MDRVTAIIDTDHSTLMNFLVWPFNTTLTVHVAQDWCASVTIRQVLLGLQSFLAEPNAEDPAQTDAYHSFIHDRQDYEVKIAMHCGILTALPCKY